MSDYSESSVQNLCLYNRNKLNVTGIDSVDSFDDISICATTSEGEKIFIEGNDITITDVNLDKKCFEAIGTFTSVQYSDNSIREKRGLLSGLFKNK